MGDVQVVLTHSARDDVQLWVGHDESLRHELIEEVEKIAESPVEHCYPGSDTDRESNTLQARYDSRVVDGCRVILHFAAFTPGATTITLVAVRVERDE